MLFILDKQMRAIGVLNNKSPQGLPFFNDKQTEAIENNLNVLQFDVPANHEKSTNLMEEGFIVYPDMDGKKQLYVIKRIRESYRDTSLMTVECEHASTGELLNSYVRPTAPLRSYSLEQAMQYALETSDWNLGDVDADYGIRDIVYDNYITVKEAIQQLSQMFEVEFEYEVIFDGTHVRDKLIHVKKKRGRKTNVVLEVTKDVQGIEREVNTDNLITAVYCRGKDGLTLEGLEPQNDPRFVNTADYIADMDAFKKYAVNGRHKFGFYEDDSPTQMELFNNGKKFLEQHSEPSYTYTAEIVTLERLTGYEHKAVRIGDTILIKDFKNRPNDPLILEARVVEVTRSKTDPMSDVVVLGDYKKIDYSVRTAIINTQRMIRAQEQAVQELKDATTPDAIKDAVVEHRDFKTIIDNKADNKVLEDYVQKIDLTKTVEEIEDKITQEIDNIDFSPYATKAEVEQTAHNLDFKFSSSGGVNLIKNSVGYAGTDFWDVILDPNGSVDTTYSSDVIERGVGAGHVLKGATLRQEVVVTNQTYTFSAIVKKGSSGKGHIKIYNNGEVHIQDFYLNHSYDYVRVELSFVPTANSIIVELYGDLNSEIIFTGVMLNVGEVALQWQHSSGEVYNTNVLMDMRGIRVASNQYEGYTAITPEEFAGYAEVMDESTGQLEMKKVFTLNRDVTEVAKLDAEQEINMAPIKVVPVVSSTINGWAFVKE